MTLPLLALALALVAAEPDPCDVDKVDAEEAEGVDAEKASDTLFTGPFSFYFENDSIAPGGGDESYTQGLELQATLREQRLPQPLRFLRKITRKPMCGRFNGRDSQQGSSFVLGQTFFTPQNIITYEPRLEDRPFVAHLYAGVSSVFLNDLWEKDEATGERFHPRRVTTTLLTGVTGDDLAGAHWAQASFHVLRESRIPKGWRTQAGNRPELNAIFIEEDVLSPERWRPHADVTLVSQAALGTTQTFGSLGAVLRFGRKITGFPPLGIAQSAGKKAPDKFELAGLIGGEAKALAWSRFADQGGAGRPSLRHLVYEWKFGAMARWPSGLSLSYVVRRRSQEIEPLVEGLVAKHWIASILVSKSPSDVRAADRPRFAFLKGVRANFSLGWGRSSSERGLPARPTTSQAGHWGLEKNLFTDRFAVGVETTGLAREQGEGDRLSHKDTFLLAKIATLGFNVLPKPKAADETKPQLPGRHQLQLRLGAGLATVKTQTTPTEGTIVEPKDLENVSDSGSSVLMGLRYTAELGRPLSFAVNGSFVRLFLDGTNTGVRRASYWTATLGVQLHPWGRDRSRQ